MTQTRLYALLAIVGLILPWSQYVPFIQNEGLNLPLFISHVVANGPTIGFTLDIVWATFVFWIWSFSDSRKHNVPHWWAAFLAGLCLGLSVALPLYLAVRAANSSARGAANA